MKLRSFLAAIIIFLLTTSISFGYNLTFRPRLSVQGQYTDNILLEPNNNLKQDDYITTVNPGFTANLAGKKGNAYISYDPSYAFYNRFDEFNGWRHEAAFSGLYMIGKNTRFNVKDNFLYTEDPYGFENIAVIRTEEPGIPIDTTARQTRLTYTSNYASVNLDHQFGKYDYFTLSYTHNVLNNDDPAYENKQNHNASAELTHWFGPKWGFEVAGGYTRGIFEVSDNINEYQGRLSLLKRFNKHFIGYIRYTHFVVTYDGRTGNDTSYIPTVGFKYDIEKDISLLADAGFFYTDSDFRDNTSNAIGDLRLIKQFEHGSLNLALLGGYDYDVYGAQTLGYGEYYEVSVSLRHQLAKYVNGNIFGSYRNTKYKDQSDREDKSPTFGIELNWKALQWMNIGLNYSFRSNDSTVDSENFKENRVSVRITLVPKVPFHTSRY